MVFVYSLPHPMLDRFGSHILSKIHENIKWLDHESLCLFTELIVDINTNKIQSLPANNNNTIIFTHIFTTFTNLQYFNFGPSLFCHQRLSFFTSPLTIISTNLLKLHVHLENFYDCLYLFDGRFNQLHTLFVNISFISALPLRINNKLNYYDDITNNLPGGILKYVRKVSLFDEHPFEHEFFLRIAQSFSMMENLTVQLDLIHTYKDYHAQFLLDTKTCLPFDVLVSMQYELLKK
ncbi:unnamed protein product [Rotaria magnacalcarata]|uniref:Uncharacterized protein n=1 Tax=Rotaria magnacalcarata TaxID=392030 RepID=A0A820R6R6_9BILA|nr:unnamed protein product [Rotaria magnacalcarata]